MGYGHGGGSSIDSHYITRSSSSECMLQLVQDYELHLVNTCNMYQLTMHGVKVGCVLYGMSRRGYEVVP